MIDLILEPWPWYVGGPLIGLVVPFVYWYGGKKWGVSSSLRHLCAATLPRRIEYFRYDWRRSGGWHLAMAAGMLVGGFLGGRILGDVGETVEVSGATRADLTTLGLTDLSGFAPAELFSLDAIFTLPGVLAIVLGGFLVGFGARWADGCTSGHAVSGLANLQLSSLVVVIGFFLGGLLSTHFLLPLIL